MILSYMADSFKDCCILSCGPIIFVVLCGLVIYLLAWWLCKNDDIRLSDENLEKNLDDYLNINKPDFAVMINGRWGTGKTYFIKQYMRKKRKQKFFFTPTYVSLYGIENEKMLERELLKGVIKSYRKIFYFIFLPLIILSIYAIYAYVSKGAYELLRCLFELNYKDFWMIWWPFLTALTIFLYKMFRFFWLQILLRWTRPIILDDFERAKYSVNELLSYINRYVEHMNKHVIIICNEEEIGYDNGEKEKYDKLREKVIGQRFLFSQNQFGAMKQLLRPEDYPLLNGLLAECFSWEWFQSASAPQWNVERSTEDSYVKEESEEKKQENSVPFNLRVWLFCCYRFEKIFAGVSVDLLHEKAVWRKLLPQFFALTYAMQIHDFGDNKTFPVEHAHDYFESSPQDNSLSWVENLFPKIREVGRRDALPYSEWLNIIDNKIIDIECVNDYWDFLCHGDSALWARLYNYFEKTDKENEKNWNELKIALKERSISDPGQLMSIFGTVLDMINNQCCPEERLTCKKALRYAMFYLEHIQLSPKCSRSEYIFLTDARNYRNCEHHGRSLDFFKKFQLAVSKKIQRCQKEAITDYFKYFLNLLRADNEDFDAAWYKRNLLRYDLFSGQDPQKLLEALLALPPNVLWYRVHELTSYLNSNFLDDTRRTMLLFWEQFVEKAQVFLDKTSSGVDSTKCYSIRELCKSANDFIKKCKGKEQHSIGEVKK